MKNILKIIFAATVVFLIGFGVVVLSPETPTEVQIAEADIFSLSFGSRSPAGRFGDALNNLGIESRPFALNGNVIFFGEKREQQTPRQIMERYQREFVSQKINAELHLDVTGDERQARAQASGEIVPYMISDHKIILGGAVLSHELRDAHVQVRGNDVGPNASRARELASIKQSDVYAGFRWIEIVQDRPSSSHVTVSHSADGFDFKKQFNLTHEGIDVDVEVPACPGCKRLTRFRDLSAQTHENTIYAGTKSVETTQRFYIDALSRRGWKSTDASAAFGKVKSNAQFERSDATLMQYSKDGAFLSLMLYRDGDSGKTIVNSTISD